MIRKSIDIRKYRFSDKDRLFLDANIWLLIYGPVPHSDKDKFFKNIYSASFKRMLLNNSKIFVDQLVLSEFINAFRQLEFKRLKPEFEWHLGFKNFRDTPEFVKVTKEISLQARKIINLSLRCDSVFNSLDIISILAKYEKGRSDFNDWMYIDICKRNNFLFVTNDSDFKDSGIPLLTANSTLFE
jgi:predicted nucleic acid-binding protein